jgi:hypothetical protein
MSSRRSSGFVIRTKHYRKIAPDTKTILMPEAMRQMLQIFLDPPAGGKLTDQLYCTGEKRNLIFGKRLLRNLYTPGGVGRFCRTTPR